MTTDRLCYNLICLLHAPIRAYDADGKQIAFYVDQGEQQDVLACDPDLRAELLQYADRGLPVLHFEDGMIVYGVVPSESGTYILGPVCLGNRVHEASRLLMRRHGLDRKTPYQIEPCTLLDFAHFVLMLAEQVTDVAISVAELCKNSFCDDNFENALREQVTKVVHARLEDGTLHNPYAQEEREQESIRTGDLQALRRSFSEVYLGRVGTLATDALRNRKNLAITVIALASRSSIAGGLSSEMAYSMSDAYIQRLEEMHTEGEVYAIMRQAEEEYCLAVQKAAAHPNRNALVRKCKDLIAQQLRAKPTVASLSTQLNVSRDYLSRIFHKEEGIKLSDYISQQKITSAMNHLLYSDDSYEVVAAMYGYTSQSHFIQAFKKWAGMTPKEYRQQHGHMPAR